MTPSEESSGDEADLQRSSGGGLSRKGAPWSTDEHCSFLKGLEKLGKGNWRNISRFFVPSRTPTQVASHAQKHFLRIGSGSSRRRSRFTAIEEEVLANNPHHPHIPGPQRAALPSLPLQASSSAVAPRPALQLFAAVPPPYPQPSMLPAPMELGTAQQQPCTSGSSASESGMVATGTPCPQAQGLAVPGMPFFMSHMMGFGFPGGPMVPSPFPPPGAAAFPGGAPFSNAASSFQPGSFPSGPFQMAYGLPPGMPPFMFAQPPAAGTPVVVGAAPVVELPHGSYAVQQPAQSHGSPQASPQASSAPTSPCQSEVRAHTGCGMQAEEASQPAGHLQQQAHAELVAQAHCMLEEELSHPPQQCSGASRALHPQLLVLAIAAGLCEPDAAHAMDMAAMSCMEFTPVKAQEAPAVPSPPSTVAAEPGPVQSPQSMQAGQPQQHANAGPGQGCMAMGQPAAGAAPLGLTGPPPLTGCQPFMMHHPALMAGLLQPAHFHALVQAMQQQYTGSGMPAIQVQCA